MNKPRVLFVSAECAPWLKVGGLADVAAALPEALASLGVDVRVLLPRIQGMPEGRVLARWPDGTTLQQIQTGPELSPYLLDTPRFRRRNGIYGDREGRGYDDDAQSFGELCRFATCIAADACGLGWRPDIVHCNEWQTALVPLMLLLARVPAASVLTIHNLAHQGLFPLDSAISLGLPEWSWQPATAQSWGQLSFLKAGLVFADRLTTVSPRYAEEILSPAFGAGLEDVVRKRAGDLTGILNGLDESLWNPGTDTLLEHPFTAENPAGKRQAKRALLRALSWTDRSDDPIAGVVARMTAQKGSDLILDALPALLARGLRVVVLGSGEPDLQQHWQQAMQQYPGRVAVRLGFDETLAHRIYAGSDLFLMPSRFEPCGLAQMSAMRYGSLPVVNPVGGLADTVSGAGPIPPADDSATGFWMPSADATGLLLACERALTHYADIAGWRKLQRQAMQCHFDWRASATRYLGVYRAAMQARAAWSMTGAEPADAARAIDFDQHCVRTGA